MALVDTDGFIRRILSRVGGLVRRFGVQLEGPASYPDEPAKPVTAESAMQVSFFWACARLIAETVATLPLVAYQLGGPERVAATDHPVWRLLAFKPNRYQNSVQFWETVLLQLATKGNAYCHKEFDGAGRLMSLLPLMTAQMQPELLRDGTIVYPYTTEFGTAVLAPQSVWHLRLFGNGLIGLSPLDHARNALGLAIAAESRVTQVFRNGAKPSGILMVDQKLDKPQRAEIRASFSELAQGNNDSLIVLDKFMKYQQVSLSPQDIELMAARRFQGEDICRFMGVPSILVNDNSQATVWGTGIRSIIEGWYKTGLRPYLERIEKGIQIDLAPIEDREKIVWEFDFDALLRMDATSRATQYQSQIQTAQITPNEARAAEGRGPKPGGDQLLIQGATVPLTQAGQNLPAPVKAEPLALPPIQVLVNPPAVTVNTAPVEVRLAPHIEVHPNRRGDVVREVVETDDFGIPTKVIEREIRRGET